MCRLLPFLIISGCLTQYVGSLDRPWASFALAVEQLLHMVRSKAGIESTLRSLDGHLSEAIMQAMQNGPHLEKKVGVMMMMMILIMGDMWNRGAWGCSVA